MTVEERLECLERRANRYRNALVLLVMSVCAVALIGATADDGIIRAKELYITNDKGPLIWAGADMSGNGQLRVFSKTGQDLIVAGAAASIIGEDTGFMFEGYNKTGEVLAQFGASSTGNSYVVVKSKTGQDLIYAGADAGGNGLLSVFSKTGQDLINAGAGSDDNGFMFEGYNKTGEKVVHLFADDYGNGLVGAYNRKGMGRTLKPRD